MMEARSWGHDVKWCENGVMSQGMHRVPRNWNGKKIVFHLELPEESSSVQL